MNTMFRVLCVFVWICSSIVTRSFAQSGPGASAPAGDGSGQSSDDVAGKVEKYAAKAAKLVDTGEYADAVSYLLKAYRLAPAGVLLYNIAYIYDRKLKEYDLAVDFYRRYIRSADAGPEVVRRATKRLGKLGKILKARQDAAQPTDVPVSGGRGPASDGSTSGDQTTTVVHREKKTNRQSIAGWATFAGGMAVLAGGGVLALLARETHQDFESADTVDDKRDLQDLGRAETISADVLMGVGAAATVTGVILLLTAGGETDDAAKPHPSVGATAAPGGAMIMVRGSL